MPSSSTPQPRPPAADPAITGASPGPFFATQAQRVALARERFFEEGQRPSGLVSEAVIQSWSRCLGQRRGPGDSVAFEPVSRSRIGYTLARSRLLLEAAAEDIGQLEATLAGTACKLLLTDRHGVVVHATPASRQDGATMHAANRVGVDLAEEVVGTTAPGVVAKSGEFCVVRGAEHYFVPVHGMYCAAAPIRDIRGELAGVLDLSCENQPFRFDPTTIVGLHATAIENRLLVAQSQQHLVLQFQSSPALLGTPLEGLAGIDGQGRVDWVNGAGARLVGSLRHGEPRPLLEAVFGLGTQELLALGRDTQAHPHQLPSGLTLWLRVRLQARDGLHRPIHVGALRPAAPAEPAVPVAPSATPRPPTPAADQHATLHDTNRRLIEQTLASVHGNVSRAARELGVSRGLLYRRLRQWRDEGAG